jgi:predicted amidohydrolase
MAQNNRKPFKLALVQMLVKGGRRSDNLARAEVLIGEAAEHKAQVVLLPEAMDLGWTDPSALTKAEPIPEGETCRFLIEMAVKHKLYICSGLVEAAVDGSVYNSAVLIEPGGEIVLRHRKINELTIGQRYYALGERLNVSATRFGTFGLMICADANTGQQVLTRALAYMGADVILSPSSWAVKADHNNMKEPYGQLWRDLYIPVARDFSIWIASASNVGWMTAGPWQGWKGIGCSMVIDPNGKVVVSGPYGENAEHILFVDIAPTERPAQGEGWQQYWKETQNRAE